MAIQFLETRRTLSYLAERHQFSRIRAVRVPALKDERGWWGFFFGDEPMVGRLDPTFPAPPLRCEMSSDAFCAVSCYRMTTPRPQSAHLKQGTPWVTEAPSSARRLPKGENLVTGVMR